VLLRETRVKLGREISVVATTLRIRQPYLQAIEDGRFEDLPGSTYAVGFVRGYAEYLGLDGNEIVRRFKQENSDLAGRNELVFPTTGSGGGIPTGALLGIALVGAAIAYGAWYWLQERDEVATEAVPPLPERLAALIHKPVTDGNEPAQSTAAPPPAQEAAPAAAPAESPPAAASPQPEAALPQPEPPPPAAVETPKPAKVAPPPPVPAPAPAAAPAEGDNPTAAATTPAAPPPAPKINWVASKRVKFTAQDTCWIKIRDAQGQVVLSRLLKAGDSFTPPGNPGLEMTVGSAGALTVFVDGKELPSLGPAGQVKHLALDPDKLDKSAPPEPQQ